MSPECQPGQFPDSSTGRRNINKVVLCCSEITKQLEIEDKHWRDESYRAGAPRSLWGLFTRPWSRAGLHRYKVRVGKATLKTVDTELRVKQRYLRLTSHITRKVETRVERYQSYFENLTETPKMPYFWSMNHVLE